MRELLASGFYPVPAATVNSNFFPDEPALCPNPTKNC
ncbi:MAG: hypothetical protein H6R01_829 [Burkholderiaceae bacterium]|nr:hypothetical protein [Burkholderiaceae bacterium]